MTTEWRADFDGPKQALESFATKPLFADWDRCVKGAALLRFFSSLSRACLGKPAVFAVLFVRFVCKNDHFAKTGSGHT